MTYAVLAASDRGLEIYEPPPSAADYGPSAVRYTAGIESIDPTHHKLAEELLERSQRQERSGDTTTIGELEHARARLALMKLVASKEFQALSYDVNISVDMHPETVRVARELLSQLRSHQTLPKIAPDGEGDLMMVWGRPPELLITVEGKTLHTVIHPATARSRHLPSLEFNGEAVPSEIAALIPNS